MYALTWSALSWGVGFEDAKQTAYLDSTLRWGFDWFQKAHPKDDVLFMQVGSSEVDNGYWGGDQSIPTPRPSYPINSTHPGTDGWASVSAAMSLGAMLYSGSALNSSSDSTIAPLEDQKYADSLLNHAKTLYSTANSTKPYAVFSDSVKEIGDAYVSSGYQDELALAALSLALATNQSDYYADAYSYYQQYALTSQQKVWNWDSKLPALYVMFAEVSRARPGLAADAGLDANVTGWQKEAEQYFDAIVDDKVKSATMTDGGLLYYDGDSDEASLNPAIAAATLMLHYAPIASSDDRKSKYRDFARGQIDYALGKNPMNVPYVVGVHPNSPKNPHSGLSSGGTNLNDIRNSPQEEAHVLYGAVVGGPLKNDKFWDYRDDWVQNEVALDYNANWPGIAAYMIANGEDDPYYVGVTNSFQRPSDEPCDAALPCGGGGLSGGAIAGVAIGVICGVIILAIIALWWFKKRDPYRWSRISQKFKH